MKLLKQTQSAFDFLINHIDDYRERTSNESALRSQKKFSRAYSINCTGDVCINDQIVFIERVYERKAINRFGKLAYCVIDYKIIEASIEKDSYGSEKQQHTFTLKLKNGKRKLIKGRNLYKIGVWRKKWSNESERVLGLNEKHQRGMEARKARHQRRSYYY